MRSGPRRTILAAVALSVAIHAVVMSELAGWLFPPDVPAPSLTAELRTIEPPSPPTPTPTPAPPPAVVKSKPVERKVVATPPRSTAPAPPTGERIVVAPDTEATASPSTVGQADAVAVEQGRPPVDAVSGPPDPPPEPQVAEAPAPQPDPLPARGMITFDVLYGGSIIGRAEQRWHIEGTTYRLSSLSETTGLLGVFLPYQFAYVSEGTVGPEGFRPRKFTSRRGRGGTRQAIAEFDWATGEIAVGPLGASRTLALPGGTQDLLSFIFQLGREPLAPGQRMMVITPGHKLDTYILDIGAEEPIELPIGAVRSIPIRQVRAPGEERMELWLAADPPRLPLRIRFFDRGGNLTVEQIATRIDTHGT